MTSKKDRRSRNLPSEDERGWRLIEGEKREEERKEEETVLRGKKKRKRKNPGRNRERVLR